MKHIWSLQSNVNRVTALVPLVLEIAFPSMLLSPPTVHDVLTSPPQHCTAPVGSSFWCVCCVCKVHLSAWSHQRLSSSLSVWYDLLVLLLLPSDAFRSCWWYHWLVLMGGNLLRHYSFSFSLLLHRIQRNHLWSNQIVTVTLANGECKVETIMLRVPGRRTLFCLLMQ